MSRVLALILLLAIDAGPGFGDATVSGRELSATRMELNLEIEVPGGGPVVAHLLDPGGVQETVALVEREPGVYGGFVELRRIDWVVVFEALGVGSVESRPLRISEMGLDPALLGRSPGVTGTTRVIAEPSTRGYGWLAVGAGAAAFGVLLLAVAFRRDERRRSEPPSPNRQDG